ncbi:MAG: XRE family transcriptional regulator [Rhodospirillales bacterium]|nr:MAG: XRE family transcriptional regulator [Rhodospirillales bacterium]
MNALAQSQAPQDVKDALSTLGAAIKLARIRRGIRAQDMAARCSVSLPTYRKVERGDPTVVSGVLASALWVLGMEKRLASLLASDPVGEELEARKRPKRVAGNSKIEGLDL